MKLIISMFVAAILLHEVEGCPLDSDLVELTPIKPLNLTAFTLCLSFATEQFEGTNEVILFDYYKDQPNELNVWRETDGRLKLSISGLAAYFKVPELGPLENQVCVAWESVTGRTTMYLNGRSAASQILRQGYRVQPGGRVVLGEYQGPTTKTIVTWKNFVGEFFEVYMWDRVLPRDAVQKLSTGKDFSDANVLNWATGRLITRTCRHPEIDYDIPSLLSHLVHQ
ncbi:pentraxin fusion protein [Gadus morhua]|nr:pentraxin fusion protein-like [Gadus morhua]